MLIVVFLSRLACIWQDKQCELIVHLDKGLSLNDTTTGQLAWQYPFEEIRASGDYENQYLWIDFGPIGGEQAIMNCLLWYLKLQKF